MTYFIPKQLKEENKIFEGIFIKDILTIGICLSVFWVLSHFVSPYLALVYWPFAAVVSLYLSRPAKHTNPGLPIKRKWEAVQLLLTKDQSTYYSLNPYDEYKEGRT